MLVKSITTVIVLGSVACGYEFDPIEDNFFACETDDDCSDGYVCAGHAVVLDKPQSYCVDHKDSALGVWVTTLGAVVCADGREGDAIEDAFTAHIRVAQTEAELAPDPTPDPTDGDNSSACVGRVDGSGLSKVLCTMPLDSLLADAKHVAMWLEVNSGDTARWAFAHAVAPVEDWRVDIDLRSWDQGQTAEQRCTASMNRNNTACPDADYVKSCSAGCTTTSCPPGFECKEGSCTVKETIILP